MIQPKIFFLIAASGLGSGLSPLASGTAGSAACLLLWSLFWPELGVAANALCIAAVTIAGLIATRGYLLSVKSDSDSNSCSDPQEVVIDEWAGLLIALSGTSPSQYFQAFCAFLLFRVFDIIKPFPASRAEGLPGEWGVMADDIIAGLYALIIMTLVF